MTDFVFASCDSNYYEIYSKSFITSVIKAGNEPYIHVIDPTKEVTKQLNKLPNEVTWSIEENMGPPCREYYSINRFLRVSEFIKSYPDDRWMVMDIDSIIKKHLEFPDNPIGLYVRNPEDTNPANDWEREGMNIGAGIVYIGHGGAEYAHHVAKRIDDMVLQFGYRWFTDQVALWRQYIDARFDWQKEAHLFGKSYINWDFDAQDCHVYTAKGDLKNNPRYLTMKKEYEHESIDT